MGIFDKFTSLFINKNTTDVVQPKKDTPLPKMILIVEDDKYLREFYAEYLAKEGFRILTAENGQTGLETVISQKPDIVLLDLMMPIMDGKTMLHKMRAIPEFTHTPVVILTNAGDAENIRQTQLFDNANAFFIKSNVTPDEILSKVRSFI